MVKRKFLFVLAEKLHKTVGELERRMSDRELKEWWEYLNPPEDINEADEKALEAFLRV